MDNTLRNQDMLKQIFKDSPEWLTDRVILLGKSGSRAYGTDTENSDKDYKGICIPPLSYHLGLDTFNEYNNTGGKNYKNTKDDIDVTISHLSKFVKDAMKGVPNNIEILFLRDEDIHVTPLGKVLIENRHFFLSKQIYRKFGGYAYSQMKRLENKKGDSTLIEQFGYDTKDYMHCVRLLTSAIEILETGDFSTYRPNRSFLMACRKGEHTFEEAMANIEKYDAQLKKAYEESTLPKTPDYEKVNDLLIQINMEGLRLMEKEKNGGVEQ